MKPLVLPTPRNIVSDDVRKLEFWRCAPGRTRLLRVVKIRSKGTVINAVLTGFNTRPRRRWTHAVVEYASGEREASTLLRRLPSDAKASWVAQYLTNGNTYLAPNFNIDTSTNVAGLTALKGGAPALTDKIWVYNLAVLTIEQALSILQIRLGETSGGAAGAGNRRGDLVVNAGVTITFGGAAAATNSGVYSYPASADASSKGIVTQFNGTAASRIILTNQGGALSAAQRWQLYLIYGVAPVLSNVDFQYHYDAVLFSYFVFATYSDAPNGNLTVTNCTVKGAYTGTVAGAAIYIVGANTAYTGTMDIDIRSWDLAGFSAGASAVILSCSAVKFTTGSVIIRGCYFKGGAGAFLPCPFYGGVAAGVDYYTNAIRMNNADIRPTVVVPTGLAITATLFGLRARWTITNIAAYLSDYDTFVIYDNATGAELGRTSKSDYLADGYGEFIMSSTPIMVHARATSDNYIFSAPTAPVLAALTPPTWGMGEVSGIH